MIEENQLMDNISAVSTFTETLQASSNSTFSQIEFIVHSIYDISESDSFAQYIEHFSFANPDSGI